MSTSRNTWKDLERRICKKFGGKRNPLSGQNSGHKTSSDCIDLNPEFEKFYFEIRLRQNWLHHSMFKEDVEKPASKEGKIPVLVTHKKNSRSGALIVLRIEDFLELVKNQNSQSQDNNQCNNQPKNSRNSKQT